MYYIIYIYIINIRERIFLFIYVYHVHIEGVPFLCEVDLTCNTDLDRNKVSSFTSRGQATRPDPARPRGKRVDIQKNL